MGWKLVKIFYLYFTQQRGANSGSDRKSKLILLQKQIDVFCERVKSQHATDKEVNVIGFHGGREPDAVDFRIFSLVQRVGHTYTMQSIIKGR